MPALIISNRCHRVGTISYVQRMSPMFMLRDNSPSIRLPKATALRQETRAIFERTNWFLAIWFVMHLKQQLISGHWFVMHLKQQLISSHWFVMHLKQQLISSHQFAEYLKQCCTQNSERLLRTPVDEKDGSREIASSRTALFWWTGARGNG